MENNKKDRCFIITPIGDDSSQIRRHIDGIIQAVIEPALGHKYEIVVAHKISSPGSITKQIIREIYDSKLVIANLTTRNPNVMYELALRHAIGKPAIMIAEEGTSLPSDIIMERTIFYNNDAKGVLELQERLKEVESSIRFQEKCGPVFDTLGDISEAEKVIADAKNLFQTSSLPMEHILQRLDRLEDFIKANIRHNKSESSLHGRQLVFSYDSLSKILDSLDLTKALDDAATKERRLTCFGVEDVRIDFKRRFINIYILERHAFPDIIYLDFFNPILSQFGFDGISLARPNTTSNIL